MANEQITTITGGGLPLIGNDIDTDRIMPARFLKSVTFDGLGDHVFADDRQALAGKHPFELTIYQAAQVLVVNQNFGCGSSREHAPQGILRWGIRAILGESFSAIFFANCQAIGLPCATAAPEIIAQLQTAIATDPTVTVSLDLENQTVQCGAITAAISLPAQLRQSFLTGDWDVCGLLVKNQNQITATAAKLPYMQTTAVNTK
jgi:3-isopropylmalate/(R)-2-methylmalate dehydratase small subunit